MFKFRVDGAPTGRFLANYLACIDQLLKRLFDDVRRLGKTLPSEPPIDDPGQRVSGIRMLIEVDRDLPRDLIDIARVVVPMFGSHAEDVARSVPCAGIARLYGESGTW